MKKYRIKYQEDGKIVEKEFLVSSFEDIELPKNILNIEEEKTKKSFFIKKYIDKKAMKLLIYELNLMLQSNIDLNTALEILIKNKKDKNILVFLQTIKNSFSSSNSIALELENFRINPLIKSFLDLGQKNGNLALNIKVLNLLLDEEDKIKSSFIKAISYPIFLIFSFFIAVFAIFTYVVPNFKSIILQNSSESLPFATKILLKFEYIFSNYFLYILIAILFMILLIITLLKNRKISYFFQKAIVKNIFLIKDIYLSKELYRLFLLLEIMQNSDYEFYKSFQTCKLLVKNNYLLDKIHSIDNALGNGNSINISFCESDLFDDMVLNLINTAEISNNLDLVVGEVKMIYKNRFQSKIDFLILLIQPIFLFTIMALILWIVLALFVPIWDMGNIIK